MMIKGICCLKDYLLIVLIVKIGYWCRKINKIWFDGYKIGFMMKKDVEIV